MRKNSLKNYVLDESNGQKIRYVGQYYVTETPVDIRRKSGICKLVAGFLEFLLIFAAISVDCLGCRKFYIVLPLELIFFCALYYLIGAYSYLKSGDRMEQKIYDKAYSNPVQTVTVAGILNLTALIGQLVLVVGNRAEITGYGDYIFCAILCVLLMLHTVMWRQQKMLFTKAWPEKVSD